MDAQVTAMLPVLGGGNTTEICNKLQEFNKEVQCLITCAVIS